MAFPERLGVVSLDNVRRIAKRSERYASEVGGALLAVDADRVAWITWPGNSAAMKILRHMPETVVGTWSESAKREEIEWELLHVLQSRAA